MNVRFDQSLQLIRTNPALSTNVKLIISEMGSKFYLESIESLPELGLEKYKKQVLNREQYLNERIPMFWKNTDPNIAYGTGETAKDSGYVETDYTNQFSDLYWMGATWTGDVRYPEEFEFMAPIWIVNHAMPKGFMILRVDGPGINLNTETIQERNIRIKTEILNGSKLVNIWDLTDNSDLGKLLSKNFKNENYSQYPFELDTEEWGFSKWNGYSYTDTGFVTKSRLLGKELSLEKPFFSLEELLIDGFKEEGVIASQLLNLTFLFDDTPATPDERLLYSLNRYLGFYYDEETRVAVAGLYQPYELTRDVEVICYNNQFLRIDRNNPDSVEKWLSADPIQGGWEDSKEYWVEINGEYRRILKNGGNYKIISDILYTDFRETGEWIFNKTSLVTINENVLNLPAITNAELLKYKDSIIICKIKDLTIKVSLINNEWRLIADDTWNTDSKFLTNRLNSANTVKYDLSGDQNETPLLIEFWIYNLLPLCDFDFERTDTDFSRFEYEKYTELIQSLEPKFYKLQNNRPVVEPDYFYKPDSLIQMKNKAVPVTSEYVTSSELFDVQQNELSRIWNKTQTVCKWGFHGSLGNHDGVYRLNNTTLAESWNKLPNQHSSVFTWQNRNLDYLYLPPIVNNNKLNNEGYIFISRHLQSTPDINDILGWEKINVTTTTGETSGFTLVIMPTGYTINEGDFICFEQIPDTFQTKYVVDIITNNGFEFSGTTTYSSAITMWHNYKNSNGFIELFSEPITLKYKWKNGSGSGSFNTERRLRNKWAQFIKLEDGRSVAAYAGVKIEMSRVKQVKTDGTFIEEIITIPTDFTGWKISVSLSNRLDRPGSGTTMDVWFNQNWKTVHISYLTDINISKLLGSVNNTTDSLYNSPELAGLSMYNFIKHINEPTYLGMLSSKNWYIVDQDNITRYEQKDLPINLRIEQADELTVTKTYNINKYSKDLSVLNNISNYSPNNVVIVGTRVVNVPNPNPDLNIYNEDYLIESIEWDDRDSFRRKSISDMPSTRVNKIWRLKGPYSPVFKEIPFLASYNSDGKRVGFDTELTDFGVIKELFKQKVNKNGYLKLKDGRPAIYPKVDDIGITWGSYNIFTSTWNWGYYTETIAREFDKNTNSVWNQSTQSYLPTSNLPVPVTNVNNS